MNKSKEPIDRIHQIWPQYYTEEIIGKGGFGTVYQVRRENLGLTTYAAVKVIEIPPDEYTTDELISEGLSKEMVREYYGNLVQKLLNENVMMESLKGASNIVRIEDCYVEEAQDFLGWRLYLRMELLQSVSKVAKNSVLRTEDIVKMGIDICEALKACETKKIIHRDIKPDNIFLNEYGVYKLGDFGIAKCMEDTQTALSQKGTRMYMAPELYRGEIADNRVDIYSLGITLYRFLNDGRFPFMENSGVTLEPGAREDALLERLKGKPLPLPSKADSTLGRIILKACEHKASDRYQSAKEFQDALLSWLNQKETGKKKQAPPTKHNKILTGAAIAVFAVIICAAVWLLPEKSSSDGQENAKKTGTETITKNAGKETASADQTIERIQDPAVELHDPEVYTDKVMWDCVTFGSYPQSEVSKEESVYEQLENASWEENKQTIDGVSYCRIAFSDSPAGQEEEWKGEKEYRYFRYEPIKWRVLAVRKTRILLLADKVLDIGPFAKTQDEISWEYSDLRKWLNHDFLEEAFGIEERSDIIREVLENTVEDGSGLAKQTDTGDDIFLLSYSDCQKKNYGFDEDEDITDTRSAKGTAYAIANGAYLDHGFSSWWLRDISSDKTNAIRVHTDGELDTEGMDPTYVRHGVRPAVFVDIHTKNLADAGTVDDSGEVYK